VELTVWDYSGDLSRLKAVDHEGNEVAIQLLDEKPSKFWDHFFVRVLMAVNVPPMGYATYALEEKPVENYPVYLLHSEREESPRDAIVLENARIRARFDTGSGMLQSLVNKSSGEEMLAGPAGLHLVRSADDGMSAWSIGRYFGMEPVTGTTRVRLRKGKLRNTVIFDQKIMNSTVYMAISLDEDADALRYELEVDWHEVRRDQDYIPLLTYRLPLKNGSDTILTDVPAGVAFRPAREMDVPALTGACAKVEGVTPALICDCKYGYRLSDNVLSVSLINTACEPDLYPERGIHNIKLFVALTDGKPASLKQMAEGLIRPLSGVPTAAHPGHLPPKTSMMSFQIL